MVQTDVLLLEGIRHCYCKLVITDKKIQVTPSAENQCMQGTDLLILFGIDSLSNKSCRF